tara:strand:+ start:250 stop:801 length:552 start_codon:yes stop_codon:yes gene_type:complete
MAEAPTYLTLQEVSKLLKCTTRTVYRKMDAIDTPDNLEKKGYIKYERYTSGNNRRLISKEWIESTLSENEKIVKPRTSEKALYVNALVNQLDVKDQQIKALENQLKGQANQTDELLELFLASQKRTEELEKYFNLNNMEDSPRLTTTKEYLEANPNNVLSVDIDKIDSSEKTMSEWCKEPNPK